MNKFSKLTVLLVISVFVGILAAGCGGNASTDTSAASSMEAGSTTGTQATPEGEKLEPVDLTMYLMGSGAPDAPLVYEELSKMSRNDINATVKVTYLTNDAYNLMLSSGEAYDIIYVANWLQYADNARRGAFKELSMDMLTKYAPRSANVSKEIINAARVDGKLFGLSSLMAGYNYNVFVVRGDFMKKYNIPDIKSLDDFGIYLDAVKNNEKNIIPFELTRDAGWVLAAVNFGNNDLMAPGAPNCTSPVYISKTDDTLALKDTLDNPDVIAFCKKMQDWRKKGYWAKNSLSNPGTDEPFKNGRTAAQFANIDGGNSLYIDVSQAHPDWDVRVYPAYTKGYVDGYSYMGGGMAIGTKSKNPERALMLLDLLRFDEKYHTLSQYGIEGKHYTLYDNGEISFPSGNKYPPQVASPWGCANEQFIKRPQGSMPNFQAILDDAKARFKENPLVDFNLDSKDISDITANIQNLYAQYGTPLYMGFVEDVDQAIAIYKQKLNEAGLEKYKEVMKAQIAEYLDYQKTNIN